MKNNIGLILSGTSKEVFYILTEVDYPIGSYVKVKKKNTEWIGVISDKVVKNGDIEREILNRKLDTDILIDFEHLAPEDRVVLVISPIGMYINNSIEDIINIPTGIVEILKLSDSELAQLFPKGKIILGTIPGEITISTNINSIFSPHIGVFGQTGSGKSNFVKLILKQIYKEDPNATVLILDRHNEYAREEFIRGLESYVFFPALRIDISHLDVSAYTPFFELLFRVYPNQTNLYSMLIASIEALQRAVEEKKWFFERYSTFDFLEFLWRKLSGDPKFNYIIEKESNELWREINDMLNDYFNRYIKHIGIENIELTAMRLLRRLYALKRQKISILSDKPLENMKYIIEYLAPNKMNIVKLGNVRGEIYSAVLSIFLYEILMLKEGLIESDNPRLKEMAKEKNNIYIVMEEAHSYLNKSNEEVVETTQALVREGRKFGVRLLVVAQNPSAIDSEILSQLTTIAAFRMGSKKDIKTIAENFGLPAVLLESLPKYYAVLHSVNFKTPLRIKTIEYTKITLDNSNEQYSEFLFE